MTVELKSEDVELLWEVLCAAECNLRYGRPMDKTNTREEVEHLKKQIEPFTLNGRLSRRLATT